VECVSGITGGDLKQRVQRIMSQTASFGLSRAKKALLATAGLIAVVGPLAVGLVSGGHAQPQGQQSGALAFEVASIKLNKTMAHNMSLNRTLGGGLEVSNETVRILITWAYDLRDDQISGGPSWIDTEKYDILAKAPPGTKISNPATPWVVPTGDPVRIRLQTLLAERFHLAVHHEAKEGTIFALVQDKNGARLQPWKEGDLPGPSMRMDYTKLTCRKYTMEFFASNILSRQLRTNVIDKTGLTGEYNIAMTFGPDPPPSSAGARPDPAAGPTFVEALHDQLGLKLERQKGSIETLVIDHVEKPDPN
jgi:bla regulator protein BlaR1